MNDLIVKPVDVLGSSIMAAQDKDGSVFAGVSYFCNALGMTRGQKNRQVKNVQKDETLKRGCIKLGAGVLDDGNEAVALRIDFIPIWLAKISITDKTKHDNPELADKLLEYQLKAKDILAEAFMPKKGVPQTIPEQIQLLAQGNVELNQRVDEVTEDVKSVKEEMRAIKDNLPILPLEAYEIEKTVRRKGVEALGGKKSYAYNDRGLRQKLYNDLYANLKHNFDVRTYKAIRRKDADKAVQIVNEYKPPLFLAEQIADANAQQTLDLKGDVQECLII